MSFQKAIQPYLGTREFYKKLLLISLPLALQQLLSSAMGIVDTMLVAKIGQVTAVGTAAQIDTMAITVAFGAASGAAIFMTQFYGAKDTSRLRKSFGLGLLMTTFIALVFALAAFFFSGPLLRFYINDANVLSSASDYLSVALYGYIPTILMMTFSFAYRSVHKTHIPLLIGTAAMALKIGLSYLLIFGLFGLPVMGVRGAAFGTLIAQTLGLLTYIVYSYRTNQQFMGKLKEMFGFTRNFIQVILRRSSPLIFNETMFAIGSTLYIVIFGRLGSQAMESYYVAVQIGNLFLFLIQGISTANAAILGAELGSGDLKRAKQTGNAFISVAVIFSLVLSINVLLTAQPLVSMFGLEDPFVISQAILIVRVFAVRLSLRLFNVIIFASLRAGGDSKFLAFLDSGILWLVGLPTAFFFVSILHIQSIALVFLLVQVEQLVRVVVGLKRYFAGTWIRNLTLEIT
ncbi:MAG: MATE family efflux transporter [Erysipelotrichaceae bacterium]